MYFASSSLLAYLLIVLTKCPILSWYGLFVEYAVSTQFCSFLSRPLLPGNPLINSSASSFGMFAPLKKCNNGYAVKFLWPSLYILPYASCKSNKLPFNVYSYSTFCGLSSLFRLLTYSENEYKKSSIYEYVAGKKEVY